MNAIKHASMYLRTGTSVQERAMASGSDVIHRRGKKHQVIFNPGDSVRNIRLPVTVIKAPRFSLRC